MIRFECGYAKCIQISYLINYSLEVWSIKYVHMCVVPWKNCCVTLLKCYVDLSLILVVGDYEQTKFITNKLTNIPNSHMYALTSLPTEIIR